MRRQSSPLIRAMLVVQIALFGFGLSQAQTLDSILEQLDRAKCKDSVYQLDNLEVGEKTFLRRAIYVDSPMEKAWDLLLDPTEVGKTIPKLKKYELLETFPDSMVFLCAAKPRWYLRTYTCVVSVIVEGTERIRWIRTGGDFDAMECSWELYSITPERTLAIYSLHFDLGGLIPGFLVDWGVKNGLRGMMVHVREWMSGRELPD